MLPVLRAEDQLTAIEAAAVPHMGDADRASVLGRLRRHATAEDEQPRRTSAHDALMAAGIPVLKVPKRDGTAGDARKPVETAGR